MQVIVTFVYASTVRVQSPEPFFIQSLCKKWHSGESERQSLFLGLFAAALYPILIDTFFSPGMWTCNATEPTPVE